VCLPDADKTGSSVLRTYLASLMSWWATAFFSFYWKTLDITSSENSLNLD
jgi:hypothetical protein